MLSAATMTAQRHKRYRNALIPSRHQPIKTGVSISAMTAQRLERNGIWHRIQFRRGIAVITFLAGFLSAGLNGAGEWAASTSAARAATTERVVANRFSGLAIEGYDPVAYFVEAQPVQGLREFEASAEGVVWRF